MSGLGELLVLLVTGHPLSEWRTFLNLGIPCWHRAWLLRVLVQHIPACLLPRTPRLLVSTAAAQLLRVSDDVVSSQDTVEVLYEGRLSSWSSLSELEWVAGDKDVEEFSSSLSQECFCRSAESSTPMLIQQPTETVDAVGEGAIHRIGELESELSLLRQQIAQLVLRQEESSSVAAVPPQQAAATFQERPTTRTCAPPPPPPPPPPAPPPPPPPPPPSARYVPRKASGNARSAASLQPAASLDMGALLRGLQTVKLRRVVDRSPGGTPSAPSRLASSPLSNDPVAIIAHALRRKFAHARLQSPEKSGSASCSSSSPNTGDSGGGDGGHLGRHLLKRVDRTLLPKTMRRSLDLEESVGKT